jgi:SAM-dependent methyltransferase
MLRALRDRGWRVIGTERSVASARSAREENGVPVFVGPLAALCPETFDLIILFHVLEHLKDPRAILRECANLLRPGGTLVVSVPNSESWQARIFSEFWFHLDVPRHLGHFSARALAQATGGAGLSISRVGFASPELDTYGWLQSALNRLGFPQNLLTQTLMRMDAPASWRTLGLMALLVTPLMVISGALTAASWLMRSGAVLEVWAKRPAR